MKLKLIFFVILLLFISLKSFARPHLEQENKIFKRFADSLQEKSEHKSLPQVQSKVVRKSFIDLILANHERLTLNLLSPAAKFKYSILYTNKKLVKLPSECIAEPMSLFKTNVVDKDSEYLIDGGKVKSLSGTPQQPFPTDSSQERYMEKCKFLLFNPGLVTNKMVIGQDIGKNKQKGDNGSCCYKTRMVDIWLRLKGKYKPMLSYGEKYKFVAWLPRLKHKYSKQSNTTANSNVEVKPALAAEEKVNLIDIIETNRRKKSINVLENK